MPHACGVATDTRHVLHPHLGDLSRARSGIPQGHRWGLIWTNLPGCTVGLAGCQENTVPQLGCSADRAGLEDASSSQPLGWAGGAAGGGPCSAEAPEGSIRLLLWGCPGGEPAASQVKERQKKQPVEWQPACLPPGTCSSCTEAAPTGIGARSALLATALTHCPCRGLLRESGLLPHLESSSALPIAFPDPGAEGRGLCLPPPRRRGAWSLTVSPVALWD